ncbi:MAG: Tannase and feruloyl esterase [Hydrocarboniphaga sp.]|uniref:tannase/feruloyl esterase family alpha/beta hydrolase n=1 Tax=Hydrocarboniphaga sp. TaxID=2033016 RepID=UPI00263840D7|nr:tannase/feruloyl esterase family alpha/beta hydrolase [Hydrocarboniphaga sp.]MDB5972596.1 Tannase and feruloyl esterase [Hydrocarboniphaga sp.]
MKLIASALSALARLGCAACLINSVSAHAAGDCAALASLVLEGATISTVEAVPAGTFTTPPQIALPSKTYTVPAFCRVALSIAPSALTEVWLPTDTWNTLLGGWGNGGSTGVVMYDAMASSLNGGYATVSSDLGHQSTAEDVSWANGRPDLVEDFGYNITHAMTVIAKQLVAAYYGTPQTRAYFGGFSAGGRQALMEASRYPEDYDGINSGAPAQNWTRLMDGLVWQSLAVLGDSSLAAYPSADQVNALAAAVMASCDGLDGLVDGQITDPTACKYDPVALSCDTSTASTCLSKKQVKAIQTLYKPLKNSAGDKLYPAVIHGSEFEWACSFVGTAPYNGYSYLLSQEYFQNMVYEATSWDFRSFNPDVDVPFADNKLADTLNGSSPNLDAFNARGGKLLLWHGWSDGLITPLATVDYYNALKSRYGKSVLNGFAKLYMVPAFGHCGSYGPSVFDTLSPLRAWVEQGTEPQAILALQLDSSGAVTRTRPLCPYPKQAVYKGVGNINLAKNFSCK